MTYEVLFRRAATAPTQRVVFGAYRLCRARFVYEQRRALWVVVQRVLTTGRRVELLVSNRTCPAAS